MLQIIVTLLVVILDQLSKYLLEPMLLIASNRHIPLMEGLLSLRLTYNTGVAFGMIGNSRVFIVILTAIIIMFLIYIMFKTKKSKSILYKLATGLILGGAIGNFADRALTGNVIDFFSFEFVNFAVFNVADCAVTLGAVLLITYLIFFGQKDNELTKLFETKPKDKPQTNEEISEIKEETQEEKSDEQ